MAFHAFDIKRSSLLARLASPEPSLEDKVKALGLAAIGLTIAYALILSIYRVYFHPLSKFPGPRLASITNIYRHVQIVRGKEAHDVLECHKKYGPVIRYGPNMLLYTDAAAFKDIYGHRTGNRSPNPKERDLQERFPGHESVVNAPSEENHSRQRRIFSNAFSDQSLRKQEPMFRKYVEKLIDNLSKQIAEEPGRKFNLVDYLNFTTFDVMADLTFSEPLGMLENSEYSPWVAMVFRKIKTNTLISVLRHYSVIGAVLQRMVPADMKKASEEHFKFCDSRVARRLEKDIDQPDIWKLVLNQKGDRALSSKEMLSNAELFMIAGTETTATLLSGMAYYLLKTPRTMNRLRAELEEAFPDPESVGGDKLAQLPYLHACIEEGLRVYPPVPNARLRHTPPEGNAILGEWIPGNTQIGVTHYAAGRVESNWGLPDEFWPERWLSGAEKDERFQHDNRAAMQAFSTGPRNCLGRNMAYFEMRLIAALLVMNFEIELCKESEDWAKQDTWLLWQKKPLIVKLSRRVRA